MAHAGRASHVGARAEPRAISGNLTRMLGALNVLNQARFRNNHGLRAVWNSAPSLAWPRSSAEAQVIEVAEGAVGTVAINQAA